MRYNFLSHSPGETLGNYDDEQVTLLLPLLEVDVVGLWLPPRQLSPGRNLMTSFLSFSCTDQKQQTWNEEVHNFLVCNWELFKTNSFFWWYSWPEQPVLHFVILICEPNYSSLGIFTPRLGLMQREANGIHK